MKRILAFLLLACVLPVTPAIAALGIKPDGHLDMKVLRQAYMESEFEKVRISLEGFLKKHPTDVSREEKVFTHMYLGVICAADSNSQTRAESHFNALLKLSPHIEPVDMFVPPKIQSLFDRIKMDFMKREEYGKNHDSFGNPIVHAKTDSVQSSGKTPQGGQQPSGKDPAVSDDGGNSWVWWTVGSAAIVAAGVGFYALSGDDENPSPKRTEVDGTLK
jgi:hypothetical protein